MDPHEKTARRGGYGFLLVFMVLAAGIVTSGFIFFRNFEKRFRIGVESQLSAIAQLKVDELTGWRSAQERQASVFFKNASFTALVRRFFEKPEDSAARDQLGTWLSRFQTANYDRIFLLDTHGAVRISAPDTPNPVAIYLPEEAAEILRSARIIFGDFHRDAPDRPVHLSILVPILDEGRDDRAVGILVLRIDPAQFIYPLIQRWPTPSRTAETLLVRREGAEVVFLNDLRFLKQTALTLRLPLTDTKMPAVQAALGYEGIVEGSDYRSAPALAYVHAVPNTPWFLVARMDVAEAFSPLRERAWLMIALAGSLFLGAGAGIDFVWRRQRARFFRERYEAADALRETNEYLDNLFNCANAPIIVWDPQFRITRFNHAFESLTGRGAQEVIGHSLEILFPPNLVESSLKLIRKTLAGERWETVEIAIQHRDGPVRTLLWNSATLFAPDGKTPVATIAQGQDITESKRAEKALVIQKSVGEIFLTIPGDEMYHEVLKIILEVMESPFGVFGYIDEAGALVAPSMTRHIWEKCQVPDKTITFARETWGDGSWPRAIREKKPIYSNEISTKTPEGHVSLRRHISLPILYQGEVIGLFQVANKETAYSEEDIHRLEAIAKYVAPALRVRLERQRYEEKLHAKNDELIRFTYTVSHDLKSPLVTIRVFLGYLEQDLRKPDAAGVDKDLSYIRNAVDKVSRLLDELLELSRIGRKVNPPVEIPLQEIVKEALELVAGRIAERGVTINVTKEPVLLYCDRTRLVQVFQNLVDNAVKFMGDERTPRVEIGVEQANRETVLFVRDNGIGIDPRHQLKLFNLFEKLDPGSEGTGIGLALVQRIVEVHGGRIWVESAGLGKGATFRFTLAKTKRKSA